MILEWLMRLINFFGFYSKEQLEKVKKESIKDGRTQRDDELAAKLFELGGYATIQLQVDRIPRMKFIDHKDAIGLEEQFARKDNGLNFSAR